MKKTLIALALTSLISASAFASDSYTIDPRHTFPSFEISHLGFSIQRGRFNQSAGKVELDIGKKQGKIDITIDATSISTGLPDLEKHLQGEDFFDAEKCPTITFTSNKLKFEGDKLVGAEGNFTMHGVTKPVSLLVDHFKCAPHPITRVSTCGANATTTINRSDFGISKYVPAVGDEVKIAIQVEATKN